ncbi:hypothetical protein EV421DRAFT_1744676 [Armillaria borealis]|uniref:Uncharacterized protein n=1 Tax=Armillaria borealis TaxID=47425 RepID=A0AA39IT20_9AGAR|nr:hypothetical protein EV421DRAFT_1744676 [Armillaria borealis]
MSYPAAIFQASGLGRMFLETIFKYKKTVNGMSIALHLLRPEYKRTGWFKLTSAFPFGIASILFDSQVRVLRDIIQQESDNDVYSYCGPDKGQVGRSIIETPELLLERIGDEYVTINLNLTRVPNLVPKIEGFIARAVCVEIHGAEAV